VGCSGSVHEQDRIDQEDWCLHEQQIVTLSRESTTSMEIGMNTYGTMTTEGMIPYKQLGSLLLPVKLDVRRGASVDEIRVYQAPLRRNGRLVYVLPGGMEYLGD
jgi:hypothetical protein